MTRVTLFALFAFAAWAQNPALSGILKGSDNKPLEGVSISGNTTTLQSCCPYQVHVDKTLSGSDGRFSLPGPTKIVRLWKEGLQPKVIVVKPGTSEIEITLNNDRDTSMNLPACKSVHRSGAAIKESSFKFIVDEKVAHLIRGKWDTDYVRHIVRSRATNSYMELLFGPYAISSDPGDELFLGSRTFGQRSVLTSEGELIGVDSWGIDANGLAWRLVGFPARGGAFYKLATPGDAKLFDKVINSACLLD
jgi:Fe-S cluster assembly iron-binding protein IscA